MSNDFMPERSNKFAYTVASRVQRRLDDLLTQWSNAISSRAVNEPNVTTVEFCVSEMVTYRLAVLAMLETTRTMVTRGQDTEESRKIFKEIEDVVNDFAANMAKTWDESIEREKLLKKTREHLGEPDLT